MKENKCIEKELLFKNNIKEITLKREQVFH